MHSSEKKPLEEKKQWTVPKLTVLDVETNTLGTAPTGGDGPNTYLS